MLAQRLPPLPSTSSPTLIEVEQINGNAAILAFIHSIEDEDLEAEALVEVDPIFYNPSPISDHDFWKIITKKSINALVAGISFGLSTMLVDHYFLQTWQ